MSKVTDLFKKKREKEAAQQEQKAAEEVKNINFTSLLYEQLKTLSPEARQHVDFYVQQKRLWQSHNQLEFAASNHTNQPKTGLFA